MYKIISTVGNEGKEGIAFLVKNRKNQEYVMKQFKKKNKAASSIRREALLQQRAARMGIAPFIVDINIVDKYIVMDKMDTHLIDIITKQKGHLKKYQQKQIIEIYKKLDECKVFHGDANILNYMFSGKNLYVIDFGMSQEINKSLIQKLGTETPNIRLMTLALVLKLRGLNCRPSAYSYLLKFISPEDQEQYDITAE